MTDLTTYRVTDGIDDVLAAQYNRVLDSAIRGELSNIQTLSANRTLTDADFALQVLSPTAARDVILPAVAATNHPFYIINASGSYALTVKNAGGSTIGTVAVSSSGSFASDGTAWHSFGGGGVAPDITLALTHAASSKTPPVDADELPLLDSATSFSLKKLTWANIKAALNSVYMAYVAPGAVDGHVLTAASGAWTSAAPAASGVMPNVLINGGFDFFQRIVPATATAMTDDVYNAPDRWYSLVQGANATINRNAGIGTSQFSAKLIAGGTTNRYGIAQIVEGVNSIPYRGRTIIAQVRLKPVNNAGSGTRKYRIAILEWTGTVDTVTSELVVDWTSGTFTTAGFFASTTKTLVGTASVTATHNTETLLSVSGTVSASCNNLIVFVWVEDVPTHASDYVLIGEAGLYDGSTAQAWMPILMQQELSLCQRYVIAVEPTGANTNQVFVAGLCNGVSSGAFLFRPPVPMFAVPSVSYTAVGDINITDDVTQDAVLTSLSITTDRSSNQAVRLVAAITGTTLIPGYSAMLRLNKNAARVWLIAEM